MIKRNAGSCLRICLVLLSAFMLRNSVGQTEEHLVDMVKEIGQQYKIRSWMIHHDSSLTKQDKKIIFKRTILSAYVNFRNIATITNVKLNGEKRLHLYIAKDINPFQQLYQKWNQDINETEIDTKSNDLWLIYSNRTAILDNANYLEFFKPVQLRLDSLVFLFYFDRTDGYDKTISIHDVYKIRSDSSVVHIGEYGKWNLNSGLSMYQENIWKRRSNFEGHNIRITTSVWPPKQTHAKDGCGSKECYKGIFPDVFHAIQSELNFTYTIETTNNGGGTRLKNGTWIGQIGLAVNGKVDFAINDFGYTQERGEVAKFLEFNEPNYGQIYIRNPKETYDWLVYTKPLTTEAWTGIMIFTIFVPLFLVVLDFKNWFKTRWRMFDSYIIVIKSLILLGSDIKSKSLHKRIGYFCIFLSGMILYWLWEAMLISYFSFPTKLLPFNTLEEFVTNTDNKLIIVKGSMHEDFFKYSKDEIKKKVWKERIQPYIDIDPIYKEEDFCSHFDKVYEDPSFSAYVMIEKGGLARCKRFYSCEIVKVPYIIDTAMGGGWVFPKNSQFYPIFDYYVSIIKEGGIYQRILDSHKQYQGKEQLCTDYDGKPIGVYKCFSLFGLFLGGLILSGLVLLFENVLPSSWHTKINRYEETFRTQVLAGLFIRELAKKNVKDQDQ